MSTGLLAGKIALVTGASAGIGRAAARAFAREGASLVLADVDGEGGEAAAAELREAGHAADFVRTDVSDEPQVEALVSSAIERHGRLDCALNNAGITGAGGPIQQLSLDDWQRTLSINLNGVFLCLKHEIRAMLESGGGAIVNVSSGAGIVAVPMLSPYCASKHAILGLTKTAAVENARTGIRVNAICPGSTDTPMLRASMAGSPQLEKRILAGMPGGRLGKPEEVAEAALWLCSDRASFVSGESMLVDGAAVAR